jgi:hypothetical protein
MHVYIRNYLLHGLRLPDHAIAQLALQIPLEFG